MSVATGIGDSTSQFDWPTTEELRKRLREKIHNCMRNGQFGLIPSPTSSGKSHNGATTPWRETPVTGGTPVVHLHGTKDSRQEACNMSEAAGVEYGDLLGREEACGTVRGNYDDVVETPTGEPASEWFHEQLVHRENTMSNAHSHLEDYNGGELPCCPCPSVEQWKNVPYDEDSNPSADVIHATHNFAYVPSLIHEANVFFDEQPDFKRSIGGRKNDDMTRSRFQDIVTAWLKKIDSPVKSWETFVVTVSDGGFDELKQQLSDPPQVGVEWFITGEDAHSLSPALTEATYDALTTEPNRAGRRVGRAVSDITRFDASYHDDPRYSRTRITLILDDDNRPTVYWNVPEMGNARSIICLDAWPSIHEWKQNVGENLTIEPIVTDEEFEKWRKFERGLEVVQIGKGVRQASTDFAVENYTDPERQQIVVDSLRNEYGDAFRSAIYPKAMDEQMSEILPEDVDVMTYGNVKSNNEFGDELYGLVTNSIDPGDDYVLDLLAARGYDAEPEYRKCIDCPGGDCPICGGDPVRIPGRGFTGPDADKADEILDGVRKNSVAQAIGRWSRGPEAPRAIVFVRTSATPDEMVDITIDTSWRFTSKQKAVVDYLRENPASSVTEIADVEGTHNTANAVRQFLDRLERIELVKRGPNPRNDREYLYMIDGYIPKYGILDLSGI